MSERVTLTGTIERTALGNGGPGLYVRAVIRTDDGHLIWGTLFQQVADLPGDAIGARVRFRAALTRTTSNADLPELHYTRPTKVEILELPAGLRIGMPLESNGWGMNGRWRKTGALAWDEQAARYAVRLDDGTLTPIDPMWKKGETDMTSEKPIIPVIPVMPKAATAPEPASNDRPEREEYLALIGLTWDEYIALRPHKSPAGKAVAGYTLDMHRQREAGSELVDLLTQRSAVGRVTEMDGALYDLVRRIAGERGIDVDDVDGSLADL